MPTSPDQQAAVDELLDGAILLGLELDTQYRVLAATVEPGEGSHPSDGSDDRSLVDRRLQVLVHPCAAVTAVLLREGDDGRVIEQFEAEQLPAVVAALGDPVLRSPVVSSPEAPSLPEDVSLHGESSAPDGRAHRLVMDVAGAGRRLVLTVTYDELEVRDPSGATVDLTS